MRNSCMRTQAVPSILITLVKEPSRGQALIASIILMNHLKMTRDRTITNLQS